MHGGTRSGARVGRYVLLERLGQGGMGEVFRAADRSGTAVALKRLAVDDLSPAASTTLQSDATDRIARAIRTTETGTEPSCPIALGVVPRSALAEPRVEALSLALAREFRALSALRHPNVVEVLDYGFDGAHPFFTMQLLEGAAPVTVAASAETFERKVELFAQLLRAARYIHGRGIVHRDLSTRNVVVVGGTVKVLDFGLAVLRGETDPRLARWGTRRYRAPELGVGQSATRRSDLYAIGVIGLELFSGRDVVDREAIEQALLEVDDGVRSILERLTCADPNERPDDAGPVLTELARATRVAVPFDTADTLESAITTAPLVGREREIAFFESALERLVSHGQGRAFRIEGASGIGKSRLIDELRTRALVNGCLVLEGQSLENGGGFYEPLENVVRGLTLEVEVSASEASGLSPIVDMGAPPASPGRCVDEALADTGAAESIRDRAFATMASLLERAIAADGDEDRRATVILLEDVQWSTESALDLVARMMRLTTELPLLVIASHRLAPPAHVERALGDRPALRLEPIEKEDALCLVRSVLGAPAPALAESLVEEAEGNPLFLVELLRWTSEHGDVPRARLPHRIETIVHARLADATAVERALFEIAAVFGRDVDLELIAIAATAAKSDVDAWVHGGLASGILDVRSGRLRFAHDKLREGILASIPREERSSYERRVGETLERTTKEPDARSAALAHHYANGGDEEKAMHWAAVAGERAFAACANGEAIRLFGQALALAGDRVDSAKKARWMRLIGSAHVRDGDYVEAHERASAALALLHRPRNGGARRAIESIGDTLRLVARRGRFAQRSRALAIEELVQVYELIAEAGFYRDSPLDVGWGILRAMNVAGGAAPIHQAKILSDAGFVAGMMRLDRIGDAWLERALDALDDVGLPSSRAAVLHRRGVCMVVRAEWSLAEDFLGRAEAIAARLQERRQWQETTTVLGIAALFRGDVEKAVARLTAVYDSAHRNGDRQGMLWGGPFAAICHLRRGEGARAEALLRDASSSTGPTTSTYDRINLHGPRSLCLLRSGDSVAAIREASGVIDRLARIRAPAYWTFLGLDCALETLAIACHDEDDARTKRELLHQIGRGIGEVRRIARTFAVARASVLVWEGHRASLTGRRRLARDRWAKAAEVARSFHLRGMVEEVERLCEP